MSKLRKLLRDPLQFHRDSGLNQRLAAVRAWWLTERRWSETGSLSATDLQTLLAEAAGTVTYQEGTTSHIGVLHSKRRATLEVLSFLAQRCTLRLAAFDNGHWVPVSPSSMKRVLGKCDRWQVSVEGLPEAIEIDFWRELPDGYRCPVGNQIAAKIHKPAVNSHTFRPGTTVPLTGLHSKPLDSTIRFDVDVVYTWVNHADPIWQTNYSRYARTAAKSMGRGKSLFYNRDELKYSLRSVAQNAPWVRNIHIVTNCGPPAWLATGHTKIRLVSHEDILPLSVLPTFNSHAIESQLHRIKELSEHFIYMNDDMLFSTEVSKADFFQSNGVSKSFLEPHGMVNGPVGTHSPDYLNAARNGQKLIELLYGVSPTRLHEHVPYALRTSVLAALEQELPEQFRATARNRFRAPSDVSIPSFLYHHFAYQERQAIQSEISAIYLNRKDPSYRSIVQSVTAGTRKKVLCINDSSRGQLDESAWDAVVAECMNSLFPDACEFEKEN